MFLGADTVANTTPPPPHSVLCSHLLTLSAAYLANPPLTHTEASRSEQYPPHSVCLNTENSPRSRNVISLSLSPRSRHIERCSERHKSQIKHVEPGRKWCIVRTVWFLLLQCECLLIFFGFVLGRNRSDPTSPPVSNEVYFKICWVLTELFL